MKKIGLFIPFFTSLCLIGFSFLGSNFQNLPFVARSVVAASVITNSLCPSGIVYEDGGGHVVCIAKYDTSEPNQYKQIGLSYDFADNSFLHVGYKAANIFPHQQLTWQGSDIPSGFDTKASSACDNTNIVCCSDQAGSCDAGGIGIYVQSGISAYGKDCSATRGCPNVSIKSQAGSSLSCEMENVRFSDPINSSLDGKYEHLMYCNSQVAQICANKDDLRAHYGGKDYDIYDDTDRLNTSADATGNTMTFSCSSASIAATTVDLPTQSYCDLNYVGGDNVRNGYCTWTPGNGGSALTGAHGTINCSANAYRSTHPQECSCVYDLAHHVSNGNTFTAVGCVPSNIGAVMNIFLTLAIAVGAVFALIKMMIGGYEIMTNPAGPDEIAEGKDMIVNAALGLVFIILCVIVLRILGVQVLQINVIANLFGQ